MRKRTLLGLFFLLVTVASVLGYSASIPDNRYVIDFRDECWQYHPSPSCHSQRDGFIYALEVVNATTKERMNALNIQVYNGTQQLDSMAYYKRIAVPTGYFDKDISGYQGWAAYSEDSLKTLTFKVVLGITITVGNSTVDAAQLPEIAVRNATYVERITLEQTLPLSTGDKFTSCAARFWILCTSTQTLSAYTELYYDFVFRMEV